MHTSANHSICEGSSKEEGKASFKNTVQNYSIATENHPGETYVIVGWKVYHVEDGKDPYVRDNWHEGVNDEGTNNAYSTLIFQPEWKEFGDFLFRVYDTDGKLYMALGKNFKLYFWDSGNYVSSYKDTKYNRDPENNIVLFFTISFEGGLSFKAFPIPKYIFTLDGFIGLIKALGNLIGSL